MDFVRSVVGSEPFLVRDGLARGLTRHVLRAKRYSAPVTGVRAPHDFGETLGEACSAIALVLADGAAFSHVTALRLLGVVVPWRLDEDQAIHVVVQARGDRPRRRDVVAHVSLQKRLETVGIGELTVTSPAQTWVHLGARLGPDDMVVLGDAMLRRKEPHTSTADLRRRVEATHKMKGLAACRAALERLRPGTDSSMETRTRLVLEDGGVAGLEVNRPVFTIGGMFLCLPDLSIPAVKVAIEYDGDVHRTDPATWRRDVEKRQAMADAGWIVVTATADDVLREPDRLLRRVRTAIARQRAVLP